VEMNKKSEAGNHIILFKEKKIRRGFHGEIWWFAINDVIAALTDTTNVTQYIKKMRSRDDALSKIWEEIVKPKFIKTEGGKQKLNCANTEGLFRIIQSIPSVKAEPFKLWLARVGYERVQEIENPELASLRARDLYMQKGYDKSWVDKRMRGIQIRADLTDEWKERRVGDSKEYAILTAEISKATFGMTPSEYKKHKDLERKDNLRDHMTDLELIFNMLGEASTTEIVRNKDAQGFEENKLAAREGGDVAGKARKDLEARMGKKVTSKQNYLNENQKKITDQSDDG
jgi:DNA-damage-inducible protein D